ncbi:hypothetical protein H7H37_25500 [Mycolicibacterium insubricum]|nr:hypothetical protein [Mycolicibacterium insubricum]
MKIFGYGMWSAGLSLVVEPSKINLLVAAVLGLVVPAAGVGVAGRPSALYRWFAT